jgi:geranylgeranyl diphosphate synthase type I
MGVTAEPVKLVEKGHIAIGLPCPLAERAVPSVNDILAWGKEVVDSALRVEVSTLPPSMRHIAGYHFGWWDSAGEPDGHSTGKAIRPTLALLSAQAVRGSAEAALPAAVAVELVHNFSLLHDDVMDRDKMRRHRPTVWTVFGVPNAILAGDALLALASQSLVQSELSSSAVAVQILSRCVTELCHGQFADMSFEQRDDVKLNECLAMAAAKTGALLGCACSLGALAGGGTSRQIEMLRDYGIHVGLAFQLVDDLLGIWGDPQRTGKPVHADLAARKKSLPVVAALNSGTTHGRELADLYLSERPLQPDELTRAADLIERAGARVWAQRRADQELALAMARLTADFAPEPTDALRELALLLNTRDR